MMSDAIRDVGVVRVRAGARSTDRDRAAAEEPLEIRLHGRPFAVIMRTPGADRELTAGFLLAERVIRTADDLGTIEYCQDRDDETGQRLAANVVNATLVGASVEAMDRLLAERRQVTTTSACGLCGRQTIDSLALDVSPIDAAWTIAGARLAACAERLRRAQTVFAQTGGLHAAGLFTTTGELTEVAEDVGRHNAVDKVVGRMLMREALPLSSHLLFVSGRTSFEIVQKAVLAGVALVASVSAPSSLAIELADAFHVTLAGFVRGDDFNIYTRPDRIDG